MLQPSHSNNDGLKDDAKAKVVVVAFAVVVVVADMVSRALVSQLELLMLQKFEKSFTIVPLNK